MPGKKAIRESFGKAASTYDEHSALQRDAAGALASFIKGRIPLERACISTPAGRVKYAGPPVRLLDIGCGTGVLSSIVTGLYPSAAVIGCDIAGEMAVQAGKNNAGGDMRFIAADCEALPFQPETFDCVVSGLALQWTDAKAVFTEARRVLRQGGYLAFSTLGKKTLNELEAAYSEAGGSIGLLEYKSVEELLEALRASGLEPMETMEGPVKREYQDIFSLVRVLKNIGASPAGARPACGVSPGGLLKKAGAVYAERFPAPGGGIIATYDLIYVAARKP